MNSDFLNLSLISAIITVICNWSVAGAKIWDNREQPILLHWTCISRTALRLSLWVAKKWVKKMQTQFYAVTECSLPWYGIHFIGNLSEDEGTVDNS